MKTSFCWVVAAVWAAIAPDRAQGQADGVPSQYRNLFVPVAVPAWGGVPVQGPAAEQAVVANAAIVPAGYTAVTNVTRVKVGEWRLFHRRPVVTVTNIMLVPNTSVTVARKATWRETLGYSSSSYSYGGGYYGGMMSPWWTGPLGNGTIPMGSFYSAYGWAPGFGGSRNFSGGMGFTGYNSVQTPGQSGTAPAGAQFVPAPIPVGGGWVPPRR